MRRAAAALLSLGLSLGPAAAVEPDEVMKDPALEARARALSGELRCMVCQNQSIDDSEAPLAKDLRILVRERLAAGDSDSAVKAYLTARYGDFVLLRPPFDWRTVLPWTAPFAIVLGGVLVIVLRRRQAEPPSPALSAEEAGEVERLLGREP